MPLILPPATTSTDVSDEALAALEPSTLLLELHRLQKSIQKLEESNTALQSFSQGTANGQGVGGDEEKDEVDEVTEEEKTMFEEVRKENEEVIARQSALLSRIQDQIEAQGGMEMAKHSDPHTFAHRSTYSQDSMDFEEEHHGGEAGGSQPGLGPGWMSGDVQP